MDKANAPLDSGGDAWGESEFCVMQISPCIVTAITASFLFTWQAQKSQSTVHGCCFGGHDKQEERMQTTCGMALSREAKSLVEISFRFVSSGGLVQGDNAIFWSGRG